MTDFNRIHYRAVIEFLTQLENVSPQQIHNRTTVVGLYGEDAPSYATVSVSKFKETSWSEIFEPEGAQVCDRQVVDMTVRTVLFTGSEKLRDPHRLYTDIGGDYVEK